MIDSTGFPNPATIAGSTAYYVCRFSPAAERDGIAAYFLFRQNLFDLYSISDPGVARLKLQWWQQQLHTPDQSAHPLVSAIGQALKGRDNLIASRQTLFEAIDFQLHRQHYPDTEGLTLAAQDIGSGLSDLLCLATGNEPSPQTRQAGVTILMIEWLQALGKLTRDNVHLLPDELLNHHQLSRHELLLDKHRQTLQKLVMDLARQILGTVDFKALKTSNTVLDKYLKLRLKLYTLLEKEQFDVLHQRISLTPLNKVWTAFW